MADNLPNSSAVSISCGRDADGNVPSSILEDESDDSALRMMLWNMEECWSCRNILVRGVDNAMPAISSGSALPAMDSSTGLNLPTARGIEMVNSMIDGPMDAKPVEEKIRRRSLTDMPLGSRARTAADSGFDPHCWDSSEKNVNRPSEQCSNNNNNNTYDADEFVFMEPPGTPSAIKDVQHAGITRPPKLVSIPSGKLLDDDMAAPTIVDTGVQQARLRRRERRRTSKSMTDLEFDELKGFMELGFRFNKDELSPQIVNVLPALQRLAGQGKLQTPAVSRPYLSEAWLIRRSDSPLLNWRMPPLKDQGVDMKEHLKFWARAVASTVQQES